MDGFTQVHAAGLGRVIDGNSINDRFEVALLVNGSTVGAATGMVEAIAFELADDVTFEFADEIALVAGEMVSDLVAAITFELADGIALIAAAVGAEIAPAFDVVCTGNAAGSLGFGASSAHDTSAPKNNPANSPLHTIES
ncbi:hypothetical protein LBMAG50_11440 [Phycisphaerae bacterium]|nr:hypothetical protein LBMAG50_11440 [Phycisphaerae bacterium]